MINLCSTIARLNMQFGLLLGRRRRSGSNVGRPACRPPSEPTQSFRLGPVILLIIAAGVTAGGSEPPCQAQDSPIIDAVIERLRWTELWSPKGKYPLNVQVTLRMIIGKSSGGYCSAALDRCEEFALLSPNRVGVTTRFLDGIGPRDQSDQVERFMKLPKPALYEAGGEQGPTGIFKDRTGKIIEVPTASVALPQRKKAAEEPYRVCSASISGLPSVGFPDTSRRVLPESAKELAEYLERAAWDWHRTMGQRLEYVVPFFADSDPEVFVLSRVDGRPEGVHVFSRLKQGWSRIRVATGQWNEGWFDRTVKLIEAGQALVVR